MILKLSLIPLLHSATGFGCHSPLCAPTKQTNFNYAILINPDAHSFTLVRQSPHHIPLTQSNLTKPKIEGISLVKSVNPNMKMWFLPSYA